eukprot:10781_1
MTDTETPSWCLPVAIGLTIMNECLLLPIMIYYTHKFWKLRHDIFFAKRRPKLILTSVICMGINPVLRPLRLFAYLYTTEPLVIQMMYYWPYALAFTIAFVRFWLTLYDFKYNEAIYSERNSNRNDDGDDAKEISFWIQNKSHLGTFRGCLTTATVVIGTYLIIASYLQTMSPTYALMFQFSYLGILAWFTVIIDRKIAQHCGVDAFYIAQEFNMVRIPGIVFVLLWAVSILINPLFPPLSGIISTFASYVCTSVAMSMYNVIGIHWAICRYYADQVSTAVTRTSQIQIIPIHQFLELNAGYWLFFEYLISEFSTVNLQFITDVMYIKDKFNTNKADASDKLTKLKWFNLLKNADVSSSVMDCQQLRDAMVSIHEMYIKRGATFQIEISDTLRVEMDAQNKENINTFDTCVEEVLRALHGAYDRFACTEKYRLFVETIK